uniref:Uncharacterized protein n=1 Tax=Salix viminalis TaxID=40686 RepID=A0A6N2M099_SALVM
MVWRKKPQEHLQLALDKLSFANSAYQDREINSCFVADDINYRNLNFKMLHGSKNLAAEKKILREIKASEKGKIVSLWSSLTEIDNSIYRLRYTPCYPSHDSAGGDKQMLKEMKQLEIAREKAVANASVKGKIWNSLGTKKALQEEFKSDREEVLSRLRILHEREKRLKYDMVWRKKPQEHLQLALDKLSFANSAYQDREINSCLVADDINYRNFNFKMLHGSKNLAAEKKILREIKASEKGKIVSLWSSLTEIDNSSDREEVLSRLKILHESEKRLKYDMVWRKKPQEHLQLALDKLSFANSAYQDREINSCLVADDINYRNLNFKMLHGSKNLAAEKKILREIKASEKGKIVSLWSSLTEIDNSSYGHQALDLILFATPKCLPLTLPLFIYTLIIGFLI